MAAKLQGDGPKSTIFSWLWKHWNISRKAAASAVLKGLVGSLLNIKPLLRLVDGVVTPLEKVQRVQQSGSPHGGYWHWHEIKPGDRFTFGVAHIASPKNAETARRARSGRKYPEAEIMVS
jgi:fatty acid-binding protein DegV